MHKIIKSLVLPPLSLLLNKQRIIFIMGHMRSGSTLLNHFLLSSKEVNGMGETNITYHTSKDLVKLKGKILLNGIKKHSLTKYAIDQINHSSKTPDIKLLQSEDVKIIFIFRSPIASISSLMRLSKSYYNNSWTIERAASYYIDRLDYLSNLWDVTNGKIAVDYDDLTNDPKTPLHLIEEYLGISIKSYNDYQTYKFTGKSGDPGISIIKGRIVHSDKPLYPLNYNIENTVNKAYHELKDKITKNKL